MQDNLGLENTRRQLQQLINFLNKQSLKENNNLLDEAVNSLMVSQSYLNKFAQNKILNWRLKNEN
jgi:site-specific recombinase XerC|tara:strand:+ start:559 stop:753 length:195 start_codon:yes stop_codon:yes gene_type:complete